MCDMTMNNSVSLENRSDASALCCIRCDAVHMQLSKGPARGYFSFNAVYVCPLLALYVCRSTMPVDASSEAVLEDPRIIELRNINSRFQTVVAYLKARHTPRSIEASIAEAEACLYDHTPSFITSDGVSFEGTRHVGSLMKLCDALDVKVKMGGSGKGVLKECAALLERKVVLLREVHGV